MAKYGLIGDPIKGSGSLALFEAAYKGVKGGEYSYDLIAVSYTHLTLPTNREV